MASRDTTVKVEWNGKELMIEAAKKMETNAERVGMMLDGAVVRSLSTGQKVRRSGTGRGARLVGLNPSDPGDPPHVLHGLLRNSIRHRVEVKRGRINIWIGANTPYARALEYGNPKGHLKPRPYLRPAIHKNREKAMKRLVKGVFPKDKKGKR